MTFEKAKPRDIAYAKLLSAGSLIVQHVPSLDKPIGVSGNSLQVPLRWKHVPLNSSAHNHDSWLVFDAQADSARLLPNKFSAVANLSVAREKLDVKQFTAINSVHAVAYRLGTTMMVGFKADESLFFEDSVDDDQMRSTIGMRVGAGALQAAMGLYDTVHNRFASFHDERSRGPIVAMADNTAKFV